MINQYYFNGFLPTPVLKAGTYFYGMDFKQKHVLNFELVENFISFRILFYEISSQNFVKFFYIESSSSA